MEPDGVCLECTPRFDFNTLADLLRAKYDGDFAIASPDDHGLPIARKRMYMWFDRRQSVDETHARVRDMLDCTRRIPMILPETYLRATPAELLRHYNKVLEAGVRAGKLSAATSVLRRQRAKGPPVSQLSVRDILHGGFLERYDQYREKLKNELARHGCHLVDIMKNKVQRET